MTQRVLQSLSLRADARIYSQGIRNLNDGLSALSIAEGALGQLSTIVTRQMELASQAANEVYGRAQRVALETEANSLVREFNRIVQSTSFNGVNLLDRSSLNLTLQAGRGDNSSLSVGLGSLFGRNIGAGSFGGTITANMTVDADEAIPVDVNGDGFADMVTVSNHLSVRFGNGDGTFGAVTTHGTASPDEYDRLRVGDFNGDGKADFVANDSTNGNLMIYLNNGDGTFRTTSTIDESVAIFESAVLAGDLNGDGADDLIYGDGSGNNYVRISNRNGTFGSAMLIGSTGLQGGFTLGDFNNDGKLDLIANNSGSSRTILYLGNGDGSFNASLTINSSGTNPVQAVALDIDRDGNMDFVLADGGGTTLSVYMGNGNGTFQSRRTIDLGFTPSFSSIRVGDLNNDGFQDLFVSNNTTNSRILTNNGNGSFSVQNPGTIGSGNLVAATLGDINGDGVLDLITAFGGASTEVRINLQNTSQVSTQSLLDLQTQEQARSALTYLSSELRRITSELGSIGSHQSRIGVATKVLQVARDNYISAESRIMDIDMAEESANSVRLRILQQVGASILAQANLQPQLALRLLGRNR